MCVIYPGIQNKYNLVVLINHLLNLPRKLPIFFKKKKSTRAQNKIVNLKSGNVSDLKKNNYYYVLQCFLCSDQSSF